MAEDQPRERGCGWGVGLAIFVVLGAVFSVFLMLPLGMSSDGCGQYDERFMCTSTGQALLPALPLLALAAGLVAAIVGLALGRRWKSAPGIGLGSAVGCYLVTVTVALSLSTASEQPPDPGRVNAAYDQLAKRPAIETMLPRYRRLALDIQAGFGPEPWPAPTESPRHCDPPLGIVGDDAEQGSIGNGVDDTATVEQLASLDAVLTAQGFTREQGTGPFEARYRDGYGAEANVSIQPRLSFWVDTGCFLTAEAKQRGWPALAP